MNLQGRNLSLELHGDDVKLLQSELAILGLKLPLTETAQGVFGAVTQRAVMEFQKKFAKEGLKPTGIVDPATAALINREVDTKQAPKPAPTPDPAPAPVPVPAPIATGGGCVVRGMVRQADSTPASGLRVVALNQGLTAPTSLGEATTGADGSYSIAYQPPAPVAAAKTGTYLFIQVFSVDGKVAAQSDVNCGAPCDSTVDLMIGGGSYPGPSEYEAAIAAITPLLEGVALPDLTKDQVVYLSCRVAIDRQIIQYLVWAKKRSREQMIAPEALYAYAREGLPTALPALFTQSASARRRALEQALADNVIPLAIRASLDTVEQQVQAAAARLLHDAPGQPPGTTVAPLLAAAGLTDDEQRSFLAQHVASQGSAAALWTAVAANPALAPKAARLQLAIHVAAIVRNHAPLITALMQAAQTPLNDPRDLAAIPVATWQAMIATSGVPDDVPGADAATQAANYMATILRTLEVLYPTPVFAARLKADTARPASAVTPFLAAHPAFELRETHVDAYLTQQGDAALAGVDQPAALVTELKRYQRMLRLTPRYEDVQALLDDGLDSALRIVQLGRAPFLAKHGATIGMDRANDIFDRARQVAAAAALLHARYAPQMNAIGFAVTASPTGKGG